MGRYAGDSSAQERPEDDGCGRNHSLALSLTKSEWIEVTGKKRMQLSPQQGDIVRLMLTLPTGGRGSNGNSQIALALSRERAKRYGPGGVVIGGRGGGAGKVRKGTGPVPVDVVDKQIERLFKTLGVHSRMQLAQRVDYEIAVMRGWVKPCSSG